MKTFIKRIVSFSIVGTLSQVKNLPLSACKINDRSERNLQLRLRPGALNGGSLPVLLKEFCQCFKTKGVVNGFVQRFAANQNYHVDISLSFRKQAVGLRAPAAD